MNTDARNNSESRSGDNVVHGSWREARRAWRQERREARAGLPSRGLPVALTLVLAGVIALLYQTEVIAGDAWWQWLLIGLGSISVLHGLLTQRGREHPAYGHFVAGGILIGTGALFLLGLSQWWSVLLIGAGIALLVRVFLRR